jgi:hypothetical protein
MAAALACGKPQRGLGRAGIAQPCATPRPRPRAAHARRPTIPACSMNAFRTTCGNETCTHDRASPPTDCLVLSALHFAQARPATCSVAAPRSSASTMPPTLALPLTAARCLCSTPIFAACCAWDGCWRAACGPALAGAAAFRGLPACAAPPRTSARGAIAAGAGMRRAPLPACRSCATPPPPARSSPVAGCCVAQPVLPSCSFLFVAFPCFPGAWRFAFFFGCTRMTQLASSSHALLVPPLPLGVWRA